MRVADRKFGFAKSLPPSICGSLPWVWEFSVGLDSPHKPRSAFSWTAKGTADGSSKARFLVWVC